MSEKTILDDFILRPYQCQILNTAMEKNTIIYLPTGAGKTFIAIMLINRLSHSLIKPATKKSVMLVNNVPLLHQHYETISRHTDFEVGSFSGEQNDYWNKDQWLFHLERCQILILTAQTFLDILSHGYFTLERVNLLIFDECHQAINCQPMRQIMQLFQNISEGNKPRVLGLTATLLNRNRSPNKVQEEVANLETTFHSTVTTVQELSQVYDFSTNPKERIILFEPLNIDAVVIKSVHKLKDLKLFLQNLVVVFYSKNNSRQLVSYERKELIGLVKLVNALILHTEMLGLYGASQALLLGIIQIERLKRIIKGIFFDKITSAVITTLTLVLKLLEDAMKDHPLLIKIFKFSSPKVLALLNILREYKNNADYLCGIVFVRQRFTAKVLFYILKTLSEVDGDFSFIRTEFIIGFNSGSSDKFRTEIIFSSKINEKIVNNFRHNKTNLLIASNVIEEGIDVPRCTLVVKFDRPMDYRSYIQSKGRARCNDSHYYILVPTRDREKYQKRYNTFQTIEKLLQEFLVGKTNDREPPTDLRINVDLYKDCDVPPYYVDGPNLPHVSAVSAISLLNRYCQTLFRDKYAPVAPNWYVEEIEIDLLKKYIVVIEMPIVCPLRHPVKGHPMLTKTAAKRSAALEVCKQLHQIKELTDRLLPRIELEELNCEFLFKHWIKESTVDEMKKTGTKKFVRQYEISIPKIFLEQSKSSLYYFHPIIMKPKHSLKVSIDLLLSNLNFALITRIPLPSLCTFPVFLPAGKLDIFIQVNRNKLTLTESEIDDIKKFNNFIFAELLKVLQHFLIYDKDETTGFIMIVPINNFKIDMDIVRKSYKQTNLPLDVTQDSYVGNIVHPIFKTSDSYIILEVCNNLTALSPCFDATYISYKSYFANKYNQSILNSNQHLLHVKNISTWSNCILPTLKNKTNKNKSGKYEKYLISELCIVEELPSSLWYKAHCLPTIIHRIIRLLQTEELRQIIVEDTGIGKKDHSRYKKWFPIPVDFRILDQEETTSVLTNNLTNNVETEYVFVNKMESFNIERNLETVTLGEIAEYEKFLSSLKRLNEDSDIESPKTKYCRLSVDESYNYKPIAMLSRSNVPFGPEQWKIFQCLSSTKSREIVNMDRLETLGDSFLKLCSTQFLFLHFPDYMEGRLTNIKTKIISNRNLFYCGLRRNLQAYIKVLQFHPNIDWMPPTYCLPKIIRNKIENKSICFNKLFDFNIPVKEQLLGELSDETINQISKLVIDNENETVKNEFIKAVTTFLGHRFIKDKEIADCVEALIGAHLHSNGITGGLAIIEWFNIIPSHVNPKQLFSCASPSPLLCPNITGEEIDYHIPNYRKLEASLGYEFKNRAFLLQALTHASYMNNRLTNCYERLEFLGDAVLDFLIISHIYETSNKLTPGLLTDLRSALVSNMTFAVLVVRYGFHKHLKFVNTSLMGIIDNFVKYQEANGFGTNEAILVSEDNNTYVAEHIHVPKVLGDLFESLAGAVFLDSGMSLQITWQVFYRLMWKDIEEFRKNVPRNPIRVLNEQIKAGARFIKVKTIDQTKTVVTYSIMVNGIVQEVHGIGENKHQAKLAAAKLALRFINVK